MKKAITNFCLIILPFFTFAQFDYSIDFVGSVDHNSVQNVSPFIAPTLESRYNFRIGGNFNVRIFEKVFIKTGLRYVEVGYSDKIENLRWSSEFGPNGWEPDPSLPRYFHTSFDQKFIEIPLIAKYEFDGKKIRPFFEFGISSHLYLKTRKTKTSNLSTTTENGEDLGNRLRLAYVLGIGLNYIFAETYQLFLQPTLRVYPSHSTATFTDFDKRSIGVEFGIRRGFQFKPRIVK